MFLHDQLVRSDEALDSRTDELLILKEVHRDDPERSEEIRRELGYNAFECLQRYYEEGGQPIS